MSVFQWWNHYKGFRLTRNWRLRFSIEHRLDFAIELFYGDNWSGLYFNFCDACREVKELVGFHYTSVHAQTTSEAKL